MAGKRVDDGALDVRNLVPGLPQEALLLLDRVIELTTDHMVVPEHAHLLFGRRPTDDKPPVLAQLLAIERLQVELENMLSAEARRARHEGLSYAIVGWALGISKQRAHQRFSSDPRSDRTERGMRSP